MGALDGKVIFITGGAAGIGRKCVEAYLAAGASVSVMDCDRTGLDSLAEEFAHLVTFAGNVRMGSDVKRAIGNTVEALGKIDVIHNNAGIASPSKSLDETSEEEWDNLFSVNLKSVFWTTKYGIEFLKQTRGCILNTSSLVGEIGQGNHAAYVGTKGGMNALTKAMALDYAPFGVRVNAVCPAGVWTPMLRKWSGEQPEPASIAQYLDGIHPLGYCPEGDVIADVAVFLVSEAARFVTGCMMPVSGGAELGYKR
ncbi:SDR family oxidoreductase [Dyadobacter sp. CY261]|uniref:SDR family NAD(P)-dependent oxidoreductase n=1 Tax=Dyadobacter sp. CY261 TaxID=2907203 RepID=UPI001F43A1E7|nr:SDR family oxidoreductase [Dyadobacter sp. CY261]MCF0074148.1 SDR family oxidoreductase [Dyadobacter sp. CY261]